MAEPEPSKRKESPLRSPAGVSIAWDKDGNIQPPLAGMHQRLYDRLIAAKKRYDETEENQDFREYMARHREFARAATMARDRHTKAIRETITHRALADQVKQAHARWQETLAPDDRDTYFALKKELAYAVMAELYDENGEQIQCLKSS